MVVVHTFTCSMQVRTMQVPFLYLCQNWLLRTVTFWGGKYLVMGSSRIELCQCLHVSLKLVIDKDFGYENWKAWPWCGGGPGKLQAWQVSLRKWVSAPEQIDVGWAAAGGRPALIFLPWPGRHQGGCLWLSGRSSEARRTHPLGSPVEKVWNRFSPFL